MQLGLWHLNLPYVLVLARLSAPERASLSVAIESSFLLLNISIKSNTDSLWVKESYTTCLFIVK